MQTVDYVAKAKRLMQRHARTAALIIVPLASAVASQASVLLPVSNFVCGTNGAAPASCPSGAGVTQLADPGDGIQGLKFFTNGPVTIFSSGTGVSMDFNTSGPLGGGFLPVGTTIPVAYAFSISGSAVTTWNLSFVFAEAESVFDQFQVSGSGTGPFSGSGLITLTTQASGSVVVESILNVATSSSGDVGIDVPQGSLDFNPVAGAAVPEPASMGLLGSALAGLALWLRKRR